MPNDNNDQTPFIPDGNPDNMNVASLYAPGQLGVRFTTHVQPAQEPGAGPFPVSGASRPMQIVQMDSSISYVATRGMALVWKNKAKYIVSPDQQASHRNNVAGVVPGVAINAGNYFCMQYKGLNYVQVTAADAAAFVIGDSLIMSAGDQGRASRVAAGTAPTHTKIGTAEGPVVNTNMVLTNLEVPETT